MSEDFSCLEAMLVGPKRVEARAPVSPDGTFRLTAPRGGWFQLCLGRPGEEPGFTAQAKAHHMNLGDTISDKLVLTKA